MNGYSPVEVQLAPSQVVGASVTNQVVSKQFRITAGGSTSLVVVLKCSAVTAGSGITAKLQSGLDGVFVDSKTASITGNGLTTIKLNVNIAADQTHLPLLGAGRVLVTTGAGSSITIDSINVLQEE